MSHAGSCSWNDDLLPSSLLSHRERQEVHAKPGERGQSLGRRRRVPAFPGLPSAVLSSLKRFRVGSGTGASPILRGALLWHPTAGKIAAAGEEPIRLEKFMRARVLCRFRMSSGFHDDHDGAPSPKTRLKRSGNRAELRRRPGPRWMPAGPACWPTLPARSRAHCTKGGPRLRRALRAAPRLQHAEHLGGFFDEAHLAKILQSPAKGPKGEKARRPGLLSLCPAKLQDQRQEFSAAQSLLRCRLRACSAVPKP